MMQDEQLKTRLTRLVRGLRSHTLSEDLSRQQALSHRSDKILFDGAIRNRKRIILLTSGCRVQTCTMCPFPNDTLAGISTQDMIQQFNNVFLNDSVDNYEVITIFNDGNFFNDAEISPDVRETVYRKIQNSTASYLIVESLPQFATLEKLNSAKRYLGKKKLAVFMGLQSSNDVIREIAINTSCTKKAFATASQNMLSRDFIPLAFLMIKPPFLLESEAIEDACESLRYLSDIGVKNATLCPARVAPLTVMQILHQRGLYEPLWIWSVIEILKRHADAKNSLPMINTTELKPAHNTDSTCAQACLLCWDPVISALEEFLYNRDFTLLNNIQCGCQQDYAKFKITENPDWAELDVRTRINDFIGTLPDESMSHAGQL